MDPEPAQPLPSASRLRRLASPGKSGMHSTALPVARAQPKAQGGPADSEAAAKGQGRACGATMEISQAATQPGPEARPGPLSGQ
jgi:hypothetical protein